ncbi:hypothetical protein [Streptomyces oceani]|uniref:Uncharacterized protein n=1 Tax=Streptomyces oceani TaxID=1075402 RepID=A0A1E7KJX6_9ACTN|nr:hypothetical protein [Streptomyces oceani]OEV04171.1 hypothetical protein AN216_08150 [Streptomyces oceani]
MPRTGWRHPVTAAVRTGSGPVGRALLGTALIMYSSGDRRLSPHSILHLDTRASLPEARRIGPGVVLFRQASLLGEGARSWVTE